MAWTYSLSTGKDSNSNSKNQLSKIKLLPSTTPLRKLDKKTTKTLSSSTPSLVSNNGSNDNASRLNCSTIVKRITKTNVTPKLTMAGEIRISSVRNTTNGNHLIGNSRNSGMNAMKTKRTPRKLWTLQDRSAVSVKLLKANLAEDGCEEAQLDVAKNLLNDDEIVEERIRNESSRLAVYWLIKSSEQGNEEATRLLGECLKSGKGITSQNILDVKNCVDAPRNEKMSFKAARLLHGKLNNGEEFVTTTQLWARLHSKRKDKSPITLPTTPNQQPEDSSSDNESEINFSSFLDTTFVVGSGSNDHDRLDYNIRDTGGSGDAPPSPNENRILNPPSDTKYLLSCGTNAGVKMTMEDLMKTATEYNAGEIPGISIDPTADVPIKSNWNLVSFFSAFVFQFVLVLFLVGTISSNACCTLGTIYLLLWSSYNLRLWSKRQCIFQDWTCSFKSVLREGSWDDSFAQNRLFAKWLTPYLTGSVVCLALLIIRPSTFATSIFGTTMLLSILRNCMHGKLRPSSRSLALITLSLIRNFVLPYGYGLGDFRRYFDLPYLQEYLPSSVVRFVADVFPEYFTILMAVNTLYGIIVLRIIWSGKTAFTELLIDLWFQLVTSSLVSLSVEELALAGILIVALELISFFATSTSKFSLTKLTLVTTAVILLISLGLGMFSSTVESARTEIQYLGWEEYDANCHTKAWSKNAQNLAETQIHCSTKYQNVPLKWMGTISLVKLDQTDKQDSKVFQILVNILDSNLDADGGTNADGNIGNSWEWLRFGGLGDNKNSKERPRPVSLWVSTKELDDDAKRAAVKYLISLRGGDKIQFEGILLQNIGGFQPEISVSTIKCVECAVADYGQVIFEEPYWEFNRFENQYLNCLYRKIVTYSKKISFVQHINNAIY